MSPRKLFSGYVAVHVREQRASISVRCEEKSPYDPFIVDI